jgi:hypothetical protein
MSRSKENVSSCPPLVLRCPEANGQPTVRLVYETCTNVMPDKLPSAMCDFPEALF